MRELSILQEVSRLCRIKLNEGFNLKDPWVVLDGYEERSTEQKYRYRRESRIDMLRKTSQGRYKQIKSSLNRYDKELYIVKRISKSKAWNRF